MKPGDRIEVYEGSKTKRWMAETMAVKPVWVFWKKVGALIIKTVK